MVKGVNLLSCVINRGLVDGTSQTGLEAAGLGSAPVAPSITGTSYGSDVSKVEN